MLKENKISLGNIQEIHLERTFLVETGSFMTETSFFFLEQNTFFTQMKYKQVIYCGPS